MDEEIRKAVSLDFTKTDSEEERIVSPQEIQEFLKDINSSSNDVLDNNNWDTQSDSKIPRLDILQDPGKLKDRMESNKTKDQNVSNRTLKRNLELLNKLPKAKIHSDIFYNILNDLLNWDVGIGVALDKVSYELEEANLPNINSPAFRSFDSTKSKIEEILLLRGLIRASGLVDYEDIILKNFIQSTFSGNKKDVNLRDLISNLSK